MASYGFTPSQVGGLIRLTDKISNNRRLSIIEQNGHKRLSFRPNSMDIFALYGKDADMRKSAIVTCQAIEEEEEEEEDRRSSLPPLAWSADDFKSTTSSSDKTMREKRASIASRFRKRASRIFF